MVRYAFTRLKDKSDYIPRDYPDSVVRKDAGGQTIADPSTGEILREPIFNRFGYFRLETPTYDRGYGANESGRLFRAYNFNIWKHSTDASGNVLDMSKREPKPIIYYINADFPERWKKYAFEVGADYDNTFKSMVTDIVGADKTPEHMFEIRENDC